MKAYITLTFILGLVAPLILKSQQLENIPTSVSNIEDQTQVISFSTKGFDIPHRGGHYQGIQLYQQNERTYAYISGSSSNSAYQLILDMKKKTTLKELFVFDENPYRHAGGIQIYDQYLVVGVEDNVKRTTSKVQIYDLKSSPLTPKKLIEIPRNGDYEVSTAGAVALTKVDDFYYLLVGSWDCQTLDLYRSNGKPLDDSDCAFHKKTTWVRDHSDRSTWSDEEFSSYQNLNLFADKKGHIYMLGFAQSGKKEIIDVFELFIDPRIPSNQKIKKVLRKEVSLKKTTFKAGGGAYINREGKLVVFACHHHKPILELVGDDKIEDQP